MAVQKHGDQGAQENTPRAGLSHTHARTHTRLQANHAFVVRPAINCDAVIDHDAVVCCGRRRQPRQHGRGTGRHSWCQGSRPSLSTSLAVTSHRLATTCIPSRFQGTFWITGSHQHRPTGRQRRQRLAMAAMASAIASRLKQLCCMATHQECRRAFSQTIHQTFPHWMAFLRCCSGHSSRRQ